MKPQNKYSCLRRKSSIEIEKKMFPIRGHIQYCCRATPGATVGGIYGAGVKSCLAACQARALIQYYLYSQKEYSSRNYIFFVLLKGFNWFVSIV